MSTKPCGCCQGSETQTPRPIANRPGLTALRYRIGNHAEFLQSMLARLADSALDNGEKPLAGLTSRDAGDPAIALLDCWAALADVLAFYQERIANEGYLRTATERRSILELARLIGYAPRPGLSSSVYLAYTLDDNSRDEVVIPQGAKAQSIPGPGEMPQTFETAENLKARAQWNNLRPRMTMPQRIGVTPSQDALDTDTVYLQGTNTRLDIGDVLLFRVPRIENNVAKAPWQIVCYVKSVAADFASNRTKVALHALQAPPASQSHGSIFTLLPVDYVLLQNLSLKPVRQTTPGVFLQRNLGSAMQAQRDTLPQLLKVFQPAIAEMVYPAIANTTAGNTISSVEIYAFRLKCSPFGHNAPLKPITDVYGKAIGQEEWPLTGTATIEVSFKNPQTGKASLTVSITRNDQTKSATTELDNNAAHTYSVPLALGNDTAKATVTMQPPSGDAGLPWLSSYTIEFPSFQRSIVIKPLSDNNTKQAVSISGDGEKIIPSNSTTTSYSNQGHRVEISLSYSGILAIKDSAPLSPDPRNVVNLDTQHGGLVPKSWSLILRADQTQPIIGSIDAVQDLAMAEYGITGKTTRLTLDQNWLDTDDTSLSVLRGTTVYSQSEALTLAEQPYLEQSVQGSPAEVQGKTIVLDGVYEGLPSGRWLIVAGERTDVHNNLGQAIPGIPGAELVLLDGLEHICDATLPGDKYHTRLLLAESLAFRYKRDTVSIYANVAKASHGESRDEVLGGGDAGQALQTFSLRQPPLTYLPAPTAAGAAGTLRLYVNGVQWHEADSLAGLAPDDRRYVTQTDDDGKTQLIFGNGRQGARLPTGLENVRARYRNGLGKAGNVAAGQISQLITRPLGVKEVVNPLRASGGAERESRDQARRSAPLAVSALDRLVSVPDYQDFARNFAGIGKASSVELSDGRRRLVHLTIAGSDDIPIDASSDLYRNLLLALQNLGDPTLPLRVAVRELLLLVLSANVRLLPDYLWENVEPGIRAALLDAFSFDRRELGQDALLSEIIGIVQAVAGVAYVDVDSFGGIAEMQVNAKTGERRVQTPEDIANAVQKLAKQQPQTRVRANLAEYDRQGNLLPAQIAYFSPAVAATLNLNLIA